MNSIPIETALLRETAPDLLIRKAALQNPTLSKKGLLERAFARLFESLVYAQIWEDPVVDMEALDIRPGQTIVTIASGGCNAFSYLLADPEKVEAVDLNGAHVAFNRLKQAALCHLPTYGDVHRFYARADEAANVTAYDLHLRRHLDDGTRAYWEGRDWRGRRRITAFSRNIYTHGLLGRFIGFGHLVARFYGVDVSRVLEAQTPEEQRLAFDAIIAPLFDRTLVRRALNQRAALFGLGIPPQQYDALATSGRTMAEVVKGRVERLACNTPFHENYFAWQAFARHYEPVPDASLPPYLQAQNFATIRERAARFSIRRISVTEHLAQKDPNSVDRVVLLDAQDWMSDMQLNALWEAITRAARPGARVIFRTAAEPSLLPGRVDPNVLDRWAYHAEQSQALHARDRSAIYGGFHLYELKS